MRVCAQSVIGNVRHSLDAGGTWTAYVSPFPVAGNGPHEVLYRSVDVAGNVEADRRIAFEIAEDQTPPRVTVSATPGILWPPNHQLIPVTIRITAADLESGLRRISLTVVDEYGQHEPLVTPIDLSGDKSGELEFVVKLVADRQGSDMDGRTYDVFVQVQDVAGNVAEATTSVRVPHDQRR